MRNPTYLATFCLGLFIATLLAPMALFAAEGNRPVAAPAKSVGSRIELKGIRLGMSLTEFTTAYPGMSSHCKDDDGEKTCHFYQISGVRTSFGCEKDERYNGYCNPPKIAALNTIADCEVIDWLFIFSADKLAKNEIYLGNYCYPSVETGFKGKFGNPSSTERNAISTGGGARLSQSTMLWSRGDDQLMLAKYASTVDQSQVVLVSNKYLQSQAKKRAKKGSSDI